MIESDEFYARPNEPYERYVARKARNSRNFLRMLQTGKSQTVAETIKKEIEDEKKTGASR